MRLDIAIRETILSNADIVAGEGGLGREISWVHMVDHPDVIQWVKRGELLLTTGYSWPQNADASREFIRALNERELAGVVMAVPHFRNHYPSEALEEANRIGLPLLELPWHVPFSQVTHEILAGIINHQAEVIRRSEEIHRELTNAAITAESLNDIARALTRLVNRTVTFTDVTGRILGQCTAAGTRASEEFQFLKMMTDRRTSLKVVSNIGPLMLEGQQLPGAGLRLVMPVRLREAVVALIWLDVLDGIPHELDRRAIEHASVISALHLMRQQALAQQEDRLGYAFVASLLDGQFSASPGALERAHVYGWRDDALYRVLMILLDEPIPLTSDGFIRREQTVTVLKQVLRRLRLPELIAVSLNQIKLLLPDGANCEELWRSLGDHRSAMAVSRSHRGLAGMALGARDVADLLPTLRVGKIHHFDEVLFPRALLGDEDARDMLIARLIDPLVQQRRGEMLLDTLDVLCNEAFQLSSTAKLMGIHISTLRYRLERIEEVLGVSLEDPQVRFKVQVANAVFKLQAESVYFEERSVVR
jgi:PucR family transcriptional regulator, purine catabolism regulatory protein